VDFVTLGQLNWWYVDMVKTGGLSTFYALKMNMFVVMPFVCAFLLAKGIFQSAGVIQYLMDNAPIQKGFQCAVHRNPVVHVSKLLFNVGVRKRVALSLEQVQNSLPAGGCSKVV